MQGFRIVFLACVGHFLARADTSPSKTQVQASAMTFSSTFRSIAVATGAGDVEQSWDLSATSSIDLALDCGRAPWARCATRVRQHRVAATTTTPVAGKGGGLPLLRQRCPRSVLLGGGTLYHRYCHRPVCASEIHQGFRTPTHCTIR